MRIRTVKPEFFLHEELHNLERETGDPIRVAFIGLWCAADRSGRFEWRPARLGVQILPYDCANGLDFSRVLDACLTRGFVKKYRVGDAWYGCIPSWMRHQVINNRESPSVLPDISQAEEVADACPTRAQREADGKSGLQSGREGKGKGKEGIEEASASSCSELSLTLGSDPAPENGTPTHPTLFPVIGPGSPEPVQILESKAAEYRATFTGIDVNSELLKAAQWLRDNASRRKTAKGLPRFLFGWLERAQNSGRANGQQSAPGAQRVQGATKLSDFAPRPSLGALQIELGKVREEIFDLIHPGGCAQSVEPTGDKRTRYDELIAKRSRIQAQMEGLT